MAGKIKIYDSDLNALGSTSKAFSIAKTEELMREFTLSFSVVNNDSVYPLISENSVFEYQGQKFDISGIDSNSGTNNITQITSEHVSYRLADYTLPDGYSFVGTISQIANDILTEAKTVDEVSASTVFGIGSCADKGTVSFAISGTNITARDTLISMSELGVEIEFDNFTINILEQRGADNGMTFSYDRNLSGIHRTWQKGNGWSYDVTIADLQKIEGHNGDVFGIGDDVTIVDNLNGTVRKDRIISYTECDDPTKNSITLGVFIRDNATMAIETDSVANCAYDTAANSIQQGKNYSNVSITHEDGFKAVNLTNDLRVVMNVNDCFAVQTKQSDGTWNTVTSAEAWGLIAGRLTTPDSKNDYYATVGKNASGNPGLFLMRICEGMFKEHFAVWPTDIGNTVVDAEGDLVLRCDTGKNIVFSDKSGTSKGISGTVYIGTVGLKFKNGLYIGQI